MKPGETAKPEKIRARLSFSGWIYVLLCLLVGLAAVNSNNNVLFLITSLLLSLLFLSGLAAIYNISGIRVLAWGQSVLTRGQSGPVVVRVENSKRLSSLVINVRLGDGFVSIPVIPPGSHREVFLVWVPPRRGRPYLPRISVSSSFPFGFVRRGGLFDAQARILVSPDPYGVIADHASMGKEEDAFSHSSGRGRGEWTGIRPYRPGEGKANIVWRRLDWQKREMGGAGGQWPAHSFARQNSKPVVLDWDDPAFAHLDVEKRLSAIRLILDRAALGNAAWELKVPNRVVSGMGKVSYESALMALALVEPLPHP